MDKQEAKNVLADVLDELHRTPYEQLMERFLGVREKRVVRGTSGTDYDLEIGAEWVDHPDGALRVLATVDADFCRSWKPMTDDFIVTPGGASEGGTVAERLRHAATAAWARRRSRAHSR
ncbi:MAG: hypothetical protein ABJC62_07545 [Frankiaceae bacterium]